MRLPLAYYGEPILRKKAKDVEEINDEIRQLVSDMIETMHANNGIGLAAPQVYKPLRLFITCVPHPSRENPDEWEEGPTLVFINPILKDLSSDVWDSEEGCLSIPGVHGVVARPYKVTVEALDIHGSRFEETYSGLQARCIMHENDHINGVLFVDRILGKERQTLEPKLKELKKRLKDNS